MDKLNRRDFGKAVLASSAALLPVPFVAGASAPVWEEPDVDPIALFIDRDLPSASTPVWWIYERGANGLVYVKTGMKPTAVAGQISQDYITVDYYATFDYPYQSSDSSHCISNLLPAAAAEIRRQQLHDIYQLYINTVEYTKGGTAAELRQRFRDRYGPCHFFQMNGFLFGIKKDAVLVGGSKLRKITFDGTITYTYTASFQIFGEVVGGRGYLLKPDQQDWSVGITKKKPKLVYYGVKAIRARKHAIESPTWYPYDNT
jgi:hypothetical protein